MIHPPDLHSPNYDPRQQPNQQIAYTQNQQATMAEDRESVTLEREQNDSRPPASNDGSRVDVNSAEYAALVNSEMIRLPEQGVEGEHLAVTRQSVQPVTHLDQSSVSRPPSNQQPQATFPRVPPSLLPPQPYLNVTTVPQSGNVGTVIQRNNSVNFNVAGQREVRPSLYAPTGNIVFRESQAGLGQREV